MAKRYVTSTGTTNLTDFVQGLQDYYGAGITVHYFSGTDLVISIPQLTAKVLKFTGGLDKMYTGDAWTSGTTITNQLLVYDAYSGINTNSVDLVCSENGFIFRHPTQYAHTNGVFKLSNGETIGFSFLGTDYGSTQNMKILSNNTNVFFVDMTCTPFTYENGDLATFPIYVKNTQGKLLLNSDNSPLSVLDLKYCSQQANTTTATSHIIFGGDRYLTDAATHGAIKNGFILPLDPA